MYTKKIQVTYGIFYLKALHNCYLLVLQFVVCNIKVAILDVKGEKGVQLQERLQRQYGFGQVIFITCDVASKPQMKGE